MNPPPPPALPRAFSSYKVGEPLQIARASKIVHTMDDLETQHLRFYERVFNNHFT